MSSISVSIVLCTYNGAAFLPAQLASVLAQSRQPGQIVISDDGSSDGSWALLQDFARTAAARGIEVRLQRQPRNLGFVANFSAALAQARGELVFPCDQDDVWHPDKLAVLSALMAQQPACLLAHSNARRVDAAGRPLAGDLFQALRLEPAERAAVAAGAALPVYLRRNLATGAATVVRQSLLQQALPVPAGWLHDAWLAVCAAVLGRVLICPQPLLDYRQHGGNQLGLRRRRLSTMLRELFRDSDQALDTQGLKLQSLRHWLLARQAAGKPMTEALALLDEVLRYLQVRRQLPSRRWARLPGIMAEWRRGGYRAHATGWRTALHDVLRTTHRGPPNA